MENKKPYLILLCDDEVQHTLTLKQDLIFEGYECHTANSGNEALEKLQSYTYDLVILDVKMPDLSGIEVLRFIKVNFPFTQVIMFTGENEVATAVECMKLGAYDYFLKPYDFTKLFQIIERSLEKKSLLTEKAILQKEIDGVKSYKMIGSSSSLGNLLNLAKKAAVTDVSVLIEGETGTGKELLAKFIHEESNRNKKPFVSINCSSLPDTLFESELFGHEKGSFTDAKNSKQGLVEISNGGTLFLDEIGELSLSIQPKLLRFLETGEYRRVGGINNRIADVRIIAATNKNLITEVENKTFRQDLLFRLNVVTLHVPRLADRKEDILTLADYFLKTKTKTKNIKKLSDEAKDLLLAYNFPGNIRELEHLIERSLIFCDEDVIEPQHFNLKITPAISPEATSKFVVEKLNKQIYQCQMEEIEKLHIEAVLNHCDWDRTKAIEILGISKKTLYNKIQLYNIKTD